MKKYIVVALLMIMPVLIFAQDTLLTENSKALQFQFQIGQNFVLSPFQGSTISYKYNTSKNTAIRFGLTISGSLQKDANDNESKYYGNYSDYDAGDYEYKNSNFGIQINYLKLHYNEPFSRVMFFYGYGPIAGYRYYKINNQQSQCYDDGSQYNSFEENKCSEYSLGLSGIVGVEYFLSRNISIHAEYGINVLYSWTKNEYNRTSINNNNTSAYLHLNNLHSDGYAWQLSNKGVLFGLSVYFN